MRNNAVSVTLYDMSGAPILESAVQELVEKAEALAKTANLAVSVARADAS